MSGGRNRSLYSRIHHRFAIHDTTGDDAAESLRVGLRSQLRKRAFRMQLPPKLGERESFAEGLFDLFVELQHDQTRPAQRDRLGSTSERPAAAYFNDSAFVAWKHVDNGKIYTTQFAGPLEV